MIFKTVVSSKAHPEYGQATIPFPIPDNEYDRTIGLLEAMDIGFPTAQDCRVDELSSSYPILNRLTTQNVNVDELDFVRASFISLASAFGESEGYEAAPPPQIETAMLGFDLVATQTAGQL